jgi:hypothetical protein
MNNNEQELDKNQPIEIPITEEDIQAAIDAARVANGDTATVKLTPNEQAIADELKAKKEEAKLKSDFQQYLDGMPRKMKRNFYPHKKFGNKLEESLRLKRLQAINAKEKE